MRFKVSKEARDDIRKIGYHTQRKWGKDQRRKYLDDLDKRFGLLAENPLLGRHCDNIREGYSWFEYISHIIFPDYPHETARVIFEDHPIKTNKNN